MKQQLLCITPVAHIGDLLNKMSEAFEVTYLPDPTEEEVKVHIETEIIFTNPNKSKVYLGKNVIDSLPRLKVIATASTGTVHIDKDYCNKKNISVISITKEIPVLEKISSTAEHAFLLTMAGCRNIIQACNSVTNGAWDYERFVGRQINQLKVGVIGFGRLGKMYAQYAHSFGAEVYVSDPYQEDAIDTSLFNFTDEYYIFTNCDVVALHIHATEENKKFISQKLLNIAKPNLLLVNTSRGEIVDNDDLLEFLKTNHNAKYYTDVLHEEYKGLKNDLLYKSEMYGTQIVITPHIGGMSIDAQLIAYNHCFKLLTSSLQIHQE